MRSLRSGLRMLPAGLLAAGCFVVTTSSGCGQADQQSVAAESKSRSATLNPATISQPARSKSRPVEMAGLDRKIVASTQGELESSPPIVPPSLRPTVATVDSKVAAHLAAGEFGAAITVVDTIAVPADRVVLFQRIADAQLAAGEYRPARQIASRLPASVQQAILGESLKTAEPTNAGGSSTADFTQLITLIQQLTEGPWFDIDGVGGTLAPYTTGVNVNPLGRMELLTRSDATGRVTDTVNRARQADLGTAMQSPSELRIVSLTRLERAVAAELADGRTVPSSMMHLAGLTRVQHVFLDAASKEIWVAGPAEGWHYDERGVAIGEKSGQPVMLLDDLVTVLRTFSPNGLNAFQCLIVPRQEGLAAVQEMAAASANRGPLNAGGGVKNFVTKLEQTLGEQDVVVNGVPATSHVARVIVEADYRMKLIGIDRLQEAELPSFFDLLADTSETGGVETKALRWWLTTNYDAVMHNDDKTAFEIVGPAIKCLSEDEFVTAQGERIATGRAEATNRLFAERFTKGYANLAKEDVVFAELRNIFDLAMVAAILRSEGVERRADWNRGMFAEGGLPTAVYPVAKTVATVANHRVYNGREVIVQVAGGVQADMVATLKSDINRESIRGKLASDVAPSAEVPAGRWWWDAAN